MLKTHRMILLATIDKIFLLEIIYRKFFIYYLHGVYSTSKKNALQPSPKSNEGVMERTGAGNKRLAYKWLNDYL